ncbi:hypothetical protein [Paracoccus sp. ME4]|uniref:hypothetical protein n=1 Tax=Paracoccus sp. ME4 TaxID=3138066 RepID=UPI00398B2304
MSRRLSHPVLPPILILVVMLSAMGLGAARGTVMLADRIVLCTGQGVVMVPRPDGAPGETRPHLCPDMALSLLAGVAPPDVTLPPRAAPGDPAVLAPGERPSPRRPADLRARDPPVAPRPIRQT